MVYKSSPLTFIFKYIFPVLMLVGGFFGFLILYNSGDELTKNFAMVLGIAFAWISIFLIKLPFHLKHIVIDKNGVNIKADNGVKIIPFHNIISVSKFDLSSPWMITIKYANSDQNEERKISYMPNSTYQRFMKNDEMTEYLIQQAKTNNTNFEEPITLNNLLILMLVGSPFFLGMIYFMPK